ncbi:MAG: hypothetical protein E6K80_10800 [Candidatus Eisenbacteria bacterium]|uniref:Galactose oxidase n=1 Tax=Eiseniibacteriota bacterium TaxID=2212470 RepID=A0A538U1J8_UNCEI|nr:MAG: hypothetical protein E6K80_10800 [Candidatus Eisenbacteria bacterium]
MRSRRTSSTALWAARSWSPIPAPGGPGLFGHSAIYDPDANRMIVYGGFPAYSELWSLSLGATPTWTQFSLSGPPTGRSDHSAIYDPRRKRMVVFGGTYFDGTSDRPLNDVWALSLTSLAWSNLTPAGLAPLPRAAHTAIDDTLLDRMLLFGGGVGTNESTWGLTLGQPMQWSPLLPLLQVSSTVLTMPPVTLGDTVSVLERESADRAHLGRDGDGSRFLWVSPVLARLESNPTGDVVHGPGRSSRWSAKRHHPERRSESGRAVDHRERR